MENSSTTIIDPRGVTGGDNVSVGRWFAIYALVLTGASACLWLVLRSEPAMSFGSWSQFKVNLADMRSITKLLVMGIYLSLCCTFLPLNTGWIVAAAATHEAAVGHGLWDTITLVAVVGAAGSTIGNLHDYHLFTWMLRSRRVAKIRHVRLYKTAARWFARSPFFLIMLFNILPIPVDVVRMVATTGRYRRLPFAAASFIGRFIRYAAVAYLIYWWRFSLPTAVLAMLGLGAGLIVIRSIQPIIGKVISRFVKPGQVDA